MGDAVVALPAAVEPAPVAGVSRPSVRELFLGMATISLIGFGGVLAFARQVMVERRRWMTNEEWSEMLGMVLFLPGPTTPNIGIVFGDRLHGPRGAVAALAGMFLGPMIIVIGLTILYERFGAMPLARGILSGVTPATAGLLFAVGMHLTTPHLRARDGYAILFTALALVAVGILRLPLLQVFLFLGPISVAAAWRRAR